MFSNLTQCFKLDQGRFEILCLSGSYTLMDNGGSRSRAGGLSISLSSPDGRVIGGGVAGSLIAANPVQVNYSGLHLSLFYIDFEMTSYLNL